DEDPIPQKSRVTAFVNTDDGLRVECWEISDLLESVPSKPRHCDSKGMPRRTQMGVGEGGISGIDIVTWPSSATLYPPPPSHVGTAIDFSGKPNLFTVKDGLIFIEAYGSTTNSIDDNESEQFVFADVNGDDWFYFEDSPGSYYSAKRHTAPPIIIRTISGSDTTLINFQYDGTPSHTVLHEGRCNFAGLTPAAQGRGAVHEDLDLDRARISVQEL
ncbi:hypothetical protein MMC09_000237, partial [Bachmanniomyces sp. S44760]|nr:hypothetical protein [Bachmanniomyces sp. S44760]